MSHVCAVSVDAPLGPALPPVSEIVVKCGMTPLQRKWYLGILTGHVRDLVAKRDVGLQNVVMQLRTVCNHPYVFPGAEPEPFQEGDHIWQNSGKLALLDRWVTIRCRASRSLFCDVIPLDIPGVGALT